MSDRAHGRAGRDATTAYHEAGHAVADFYLRFKIRKVTIRPEREKRHEYHGYCQRQGRSYLDRIDIEVTPVKQNRIFNRIIAIAAGYVAQKRFSPRSVRRWHTSGDEQMAADLALYVTDPTGVEYLLRWLYHCAENLVEVRWGDICAVADALLERKTLSGDEVREIINRRYAPLPDFDRLRAQTGKSKRRRVPASKEQ